MSKEACDDSENLVLLKKKMDALTIKAAQPVCRRIKALKKLQLECLKIETKFYEELHALECKYHDLYDSFYQKRAKIISGEIEPTDEECDFPSDPEDDESTKGDNNQHKEQEDIGNKKIESTEIISDIAKDIELNGIPDFWLNILQSVDMFNTSIYEVDEPILSHLIDIKLRLEKQPMGFYLDFYFSPNDYFTNEVLTKYYGLKSSLDENDPFSYDGLLIYKSQGCKINWKEGKNVTVKKVTRKQKHKSRGSVRTVVMDLPCDSFFNFFSPPNQENNQDSQKDDEINDSLLLDFEMGEILKSRLIPRAVLFYTGEAVFDDDDDDDVEDEDEDEDDDEDEDEDDEDEDDDADKSNKSHELPNPLGKKSDKIPQVGNEECMQQ